MSENIGYSNRGNSKSVTTLYARNFSNYQGQSYLPLNVVGDTGDIAVFQQVQVSDKKPLSFKVNIATNNFDFSHVSLSDEIASTSILPVQTGLIWYEVVNYKYLGGNRMMLECVFDPHLNIYFSEIEGWQTGTRNPASMVTESYLNTARQIQKIVPGGSSISKAGTAYLFLKIVDSAETVSSSTPQQNPDSGFIMNQTVGKIVFKEISSIENIGYTIQKFITTTEIALTVKEIWVTRYAHSADSTFAFAGESWYEANSRPASMGQPYKVEANMTAASGFHRGSVGVRVNGTDYVTPYKEIFEQNSQFTNFQDDLYMHLVYLPSTSASSPNKIVIYTSKSATDWRTASRVLHEIDSPNLAVPILDQTLFRFIKENKNKQLVEFSQDILGVFLSAIGILASPGLAPVYVNKIFDSLSGGVTTAATIADMLDQPMTLSNGSGGVEVLLPDIYWVKDYCPLRFGTGSAFNAAHVIQEHNTMLIRSTTFPCYNYIDRTTVQDPRFRMALLEGDRSASQYIQGNFRLFVSTGNSTGRKTKTYNNLMLKQMSAILESGIILNGDEWYE